MKYGMLLLGLLLVSGCATISSYDTIGASGEIRVTGIVSAVAGVKIAFTVGATRDSTNTEAKNEVLSKTRSSGDLLDALPGLLLAD